MGRTSEYFGGEGRVLNVECGAMYITAFFRIHGTVFFILTLHICVLVILRSDKNVQGFLNLEFLRICYNFLLIKVLCFLKMESTSWTWTQLLALVRENHLGIYFHFWPSLNHFFMSKFLETLLLRFSFSILLKYSKLMKM